MAIVLRLGAALEERIVAAVGWCYPIVAVRSWHAAHQYLKEESASLVIGDPTLDCVDTTRFRAPDGFDIAIEASRHAPMLVYSRPSALAMQAVAYLSRRRQVDGLLIFGHGDDAGVIGAEVQRVAAALIGDQIGREIDDATSALPESTARSLFGLFSRPDEFRTVSELARSAAVTRRTLGRQLRVAGLVTPKMLLRIARVARGFSLMKTSSLSAKSVARKLGYQKYDQFIADVRRLTGRTPTGLRRTFEQQAFVGCIRHWLGRGEKTR